MSCASRLIARFLDSLDQLTGIYQGLGQYEQALATALQQLQLDTWNEAACRGVMRLLFTLGRPGEALQTYESFRESLIENIATEPAAKTTEIYLQISSGEYRTEMEQPSVRPVRGYELRERLGSGHYGEVYRAYQPHIGRDVAIKIIQPQFANQPEFILRFQAEAQMVARLEHPYIVPLYDYWREPGSAYLVMRWLRGGSLKDDLAKGAWNLDATARLIDQLTAALAMAHQQGVVHRDVKPANILLDERGDAYLADFGIATMIGLVSAISGFMEEAIQGNVSGSLGYISPEIAQGREATNLADIYGLGIVLYELLTGEHPFPGHSGQALVEKHLRDPIPSIKQYHPEIPKAVDDVIQKATAKDPAARFPEVLSLASALNKALSRDSAVVRQTPAAAYELVNPYKGLRPFQEEDANDFFGRQALIDRLTSRISPIIDFQKKKLASVNGRFLVVLGPSGSGKSSVVKAGLIPALRKGAIRGSDKWYIVQIVPGSHPLEEMETALLRVAVNPPPSLREQLQQDERGLLRAVKRAVPDEDSQLLLVIDQFEELFTQNSSEQERTFFLDSLLTALTDPRSNLIAILTLRADYYDRPLQYEAFGDLVRQYTEVVLPLSPEELQQSIEGPAHRLGVELEAGLVAAIVADVGEQPGGLPLLQFVLTELFEQRIDNRLTLESYHETGGVSGALGRRADALYKNLDLSERALSRQLFMRLVRLNEGAGVTRRRVFLSELQALTGGKVITTLENDNQTSKSGLDPISSVLEAFGRHRLLTFDHDPVTRNPTVELAHEAVLREWQRLNKWLAESRYDIRLQRLLAGAAVEWETAAQDASYLLQGSRLAQYDEWATTSTVVLAQLERAFLLESIQSQEKTAAEEELRRQRELDTVMRLAETESARADEQSEASRRLRRRALLLAVALAIALILAAAAALFARQSDQNANLAATQEFLALKEADQRATAESIALAEAEERGTAQAEAEAQRQDAVEQRAIAQEEAISAATAKAEALDQKILAEAQARLATGRELAAAAITNLEVDPERSILLALEAAKATYNADGFVIPEAEGALHRALQASRIRFSLSPANGANFSPDGTIIASGGTDGTVQLWDGKSGEMIWSFMAHEDEVSRSLFSPNGSLLVTTSSDNTAKIWDTESWESLVTLEGHTDTLLSPAWSPDSMVLATTSLDGTARLWDANNGQLLHTLVHSGVTAGPDFNPDGTLVAIADVDAEVARVWDVASGEVLMTIEGHADDVVEAAFSPDGSKLATASADLTTKIWEVATGEEVMTLEGHTGWIFSVRFSPDGSLIATGSEDGTAKIWEATSGRELLTLAGHTGGIGKVYFSPDGSMLITNSLDGTARVWDISRSGSRDWLTLDGHTNLVFNVDFNQEGNKVATASWDGTAKVWDLESGEELLTLAGHQREVSRLLFSPTGTKLASAGYDGTVKIWDAFSGNQLLNIDVSDADPETGEIASVFGLAFNQDGNKLVTTSEDGLVKLWDPENGQVLLTIGGHEGPVFRPAYSPDGTLLATAGWDGTVRLWDADTGESLMVLETPDAINSVDFSPDGSRLAAAGWDAIGRVWDLDSGQLLHTLEGHQGIIWDIAYSPDGLTLATAGFDSTIKVWDVKSSREVLSLEVPGEGVPDVAFTPDGRFLIAGGETARIFLLPVEELMELARSRVKRSLDESECRQYLHLDRCPTEP